MDYYHGHRLQTLFLIAQDDFIAKIMMSKMLILFITSQNNQTTTVHCIIIKGYAVHCIKCQRARCTLYLLHWWSLSKQETKLYASQHLH